MLRNPGRLWLRLRIALEERTSLAAQLLSAPDAWLTSDAMMCLSLLVLTSLGPQGPCEMPPLHFSCEDSKFCRSLCLLNIMSLNVSINPHLSCRSQVAYDPLSKSKRQRSLPTLPQTYILLNS